MTPNKPPKEADRQEDLFKIRLEDIIGMSHEMVRLAGFIKQRRSGGGHAGAPRKPLRRPHPGRRPLAAAQRIIGRELDNTDVFVDRGYRGNGYRGPATVHMVERIKKSFTKAMRKWMKRRAAIEPEIGHMKIQGRLAKNYLSGKLGDQLNAILCGCGHNIRKMLNFLRARPQLAS